MWILKILGAVQQPTVAILMAPSNESVFANEALFILAGIMVAKCTL